MTTLTLLISTLLWTVTDSQQDSYFQATDSFLTKYVENGRVDYESLVDDSSDLDALYKQTAEMDLTGKSPEFEKAFYINAYNTLVIKQIIDLYPIKSPLENGKFFNGIKHTVAGKKLTLDGVEKGTLFKKYPDARIHFAVVCGAIGCPPIHNKAFTPENLDKLLTERTKYALNDDYFTRASGKKLELSQIFNWYKADFVTKKMGLIDYVNQYRDEKIADGTKISYYEYDWNLNQQ